MQKKGTAQILRISILFPGSVFAPHRMSSSHLTSLRIGERSVLAQLCVAVAECAESIG